MRRVAITSTLIFDVPEDRLEDIARRFREANEVAIGTPMITLTGQHWVMVKIEAFTVEPR